MCEHHDWDVGMVSLGFGILILICEAYMSVAG